METIELFALGVVLALPIDLCSLLYIFKSVSLHDAESKNLEIDAADNDDADQDDSDRDGSEKGDSELDDVIRGERAREVKLMLEENPKRRTFPTHI